MISAPSAHLRIPLKEIVSATNNFSDANLLRHDGSRKEYKGQLFWSGPLIVAQRFDETYPEGTKEFWTEVSMLSALKHDNLVSLVGFCDEKGEKVIITKHETHGSLYGHLRDPALTWVRRLQICIGLARALSYIYHDEGHDFSVIHCDIKSSKILLDDKWEAKLSGFEQSMNHAAARRNRPCFRDVKYSCGTRGYVDPAYSTSGSVSHKSDMYSLGVVLFEVMCGKEAVMVHKDYTILAQLARSRYQEGRLDDLIDPDLRKQMEPQSFVIFSDVAYSCLNEDRSERHSVFSTLQFTFTFE